MGSMFPNKFLCCYPLRKPWISWGTWNSAMSCTMKAGQKEMPKCHLFPIFFWSPWITICPQSKWLCSAEVRHTPPRRFTSIDRCPNVITIVWLRWCRMYHHWLIIYSFGEKDTWLVLGSLAIGWLITPSKCTYSHHTPELYSPSLYQSLYMNHYIFESLCMNHYIYQFYINWIYHCNLTGTMAYKGNSPKKKVKLQVSDVFWSIIIYLYIWYTPLLITHYININININIYIYIRINIWERNDYINHYINRVYEWQSPIPQIWISSARCARSHPRSFRLGQLVVPWHHLAGAFKGSPGKQGISPSKMVGFPWFNMV